MCMQVSVTTIIANAESYVSSLHVIAMLCSPGGRGEMTSDLLHEFGWQAHMKDRRDSMCS